MKKILLLSFVLLTLPALACAGGDKVVETSQKKTPKWVNGMEKGYIIESGTAASLDDAKDKAMLEVKKEILNSIVTNIKSESTMTQTELEHNGVFTTVNYYMSQINTKSVTVPYLSEISASKAEEFYWEKLKRDKEIFYRYHIKYPFSELDLFRLADEFKMREAKLDKQMQSFVQDDFSTYTSVEQMTNRISELKAFETTLVPEDDRHQTCKEVLNKYNKYLSDIYLRQLETDHNQLTFAPYFGEHRLTTNLKVQLKTNCLSEMQYSTVGGVCRVTYNYSAGCYDDEQNWLEVIMTINGKKIKSTFYVK